MLFDRQTMNREDNGHHARDTLCFVRKGSQILHIVGRRLATFLLTGGDREGRELGTRRTGVVIPPVHEIPQSRNGEEPDEDDGRVVDRLRRDGDGGRHREQRDGEDRPAFFGSCQMKFMFSIQIENRQSTMDDLPTATMLQTRPNVPRLKLPDLMWERPPRRERPMGIPYDSQRKRYRERCCVGQIGCLWGNNSIVGAGGRSCRIGEAALGESEEGHT